MQIGEEIRSETRKVAFPKNRSIPGVGCEDFLKLPDVGAAREIEPS